jgi:hypothetical protein
MRRFVRILRLCRNAPIHQRPHQHHFHKACLDRQWAGVSIPGYQQRAKSRQGREVRLSDYFARGQGKRFTALSVS